VYSRLRGIQDTRAPLFRFTSIGDALEKHKGVGPGFDLVRLLLAVAILYDHCFYIAVGPVGSSYAVTHAAQIAAAPEASGHVWHLLHQIRNLITGSSNDSHYYGMLVPMFFALSGFLVTGSAFRTRAVRSFLTFRILRIVPALFTEVTLSALVLGPALTVVSMQTYFTDPKLYSYFGNIIGRVRFQLPGLFLSNPVPDLVNRNLWTLPSEFYCYLIIAVLIATGLLFKRTLFSAFFAAATVAINVVNIFAGYAESNHNLSFIVYYFFAGAFMYHWRQWIPFHPAFFAIAVVGTWYHFNGNHSILIFPILTTYIIVYLGTVDLPRIPVLQSGDYSYGIYLYGFPIAQALVAARPEFRGHGLWIFAVAGILTFAFAAMSWHFIEKGALKLKHFGARKPATSQIVSAESRGLLQSQPLAE
jgi:peptidoglycan/LPS O-acetylase OafA/YrhL